MKTKKNTMRILSVIMAICMMISVMPVAGAADATDEVVKFINFATYDVTGTDFNINNATEDKYPGLDWFLVADETSPEVLTDGWTKMYPKSYSRFGFPAAETLIAFKFTIEKAGYYDMSALVYDYSAGITGEVAIDGEVVGTANFSGANQMDAYRFIGDIVLSEGEHIMTFKRVNAGTNNVLFLQSVQFVPSSNTTEKLNFLTYDVTGMDFHITQATEDMFGKLGWYLDTDNTTPSVLTDGWTKMYAKQYARFGFANQNDQISFKFKTNTSGYHNVTVDTATNATYGIHADILVDGKFVGRINTAADGDGVLSAGVANMSAGMHTLTIKRANPYKHPTKDNYVLFLENVTFSLVDEHEQTINFGYYKDGYNYPAYDKIDSIGWSLDRDNSSEGVLTSGWTRSEYYYARAGFTNNNDVMAFKVKTLIDGWYDVSAIVNQYTPASGSDNGIVGELIIDGKSVGEFDTKNPDANGTKENVEIAVGTVYIEEGEHSLYIKRVSEKGNLLFLREIKLVPGEEPVDADVTEITLDSTSVTGIIGDEWTLNATVLPANASNKKVTWETSDSSVATVSNGVVTAVGVGSAVITAKSEKNPEVAATCNVKVNAPSKTISFITYDVTGLDFHISGATDELYDRLGWSLDADNTTPSVLTDGWTKMYAKSYSRVGFAKQNDKISFKFEVEADGYYDVGLLIAPNNDVGIIGDVLVDNKFVGTVNFKDSANGDGNRRAGVAKLSKGMHTVTVRRANPNQGYAGFMVNISFTPVTEAEQVLNLGYLREANYVYPSYENIDFKGWALDFDNTSSGVLAAYNPETGKGWTRAEFEYARAQFANYEDEMVFKFKTLISGWYDATALFDKYTSETNADDDGIIGEIIIDNNSVGVFDGRNLDKGLAAKASAELQRVYLAEGEHTLAIKRVNQTGGKLMFFREIQFTPAEEPTVVSATAIALSENELAGTIGDEWALTASITPADATYTDVVWYSSNTAVATVANGVVKALNSGTAVITAKSLSNPALTAECTVSITVPVSGITLDKETLELEVGASETVLAIVEPENATDKKVVWSVSEEGVVTVIDGVITAVAEGEVVVIATAGDFSAYCTVTVKNAAPAFDQGDINGDGRVNTRDVTNLRRYLAGGYEDSITVIEGMTDVNGDGRENTRDVAALRAIIAG